MKQIYRSPLFATLITACLLLAAATTTAPSQNASAWQLKPDEYAAYAVEGAIGIRHLGFFGYDLAPNGGLITEPGHPAFLSLALVTLVPPGPHKKGQTYPFKQTFSRFENFTPVAVSGAVRVDEVVGPLLFLRGEFRLKKTRVQGKDGRFYQITKGTLSFTSQFDLKGGVLREAQVRYDYTCDTRIKLAQLYTGASVKQERNTKVSLPHTYQLQGTIAQAEMPKLIDAWIDETRDRVLEDWGGAFAEGHNYALKSGYDSLYVLALLHAKTPKKHEVIQKTMERIRKTPLNATYSAALVLMALEAVNTPTMELMNPKAYLDKPPDRKLSTEDRRLVAHAVRYLVKGQLGGGWTYVTNQQDKKFFPTQVGNPDNSNTQFALMGLYAAQRMGARIEPKVWRKALAYWARTLTQKGFKPKGSREMLSGWDYNLHGRGTPYLAMTAGGLASLAIIRAGLGLKPGDRSRDGATLDRLMNAGLTWLENFYSVRQCRRTFLPGPDMAEDWAYHLYALERAMDLSRIKKVGRHDWYLEGAMAILNDTYESIQRNHVYEALCLLFLERSTPPAVTEPVK